MYIDNTPAAESLANAHNTSAIKFNPDETLSGDISNITLVARTRNATTIGHKTPVELAADFAKMIPRRRNNVKHIYLIAEEAGLMKANQPCLAQEFVEAMYTQGFTQLAVHAIASPGIPAHGMGVEVLNTSGGMLKQKGYVHAVYYRDKLSCGIDQHILEILDEQEECQQEYNRILASRARYGRAEALHEFKRKERDSASLLVDRKANPKYQKTDVLLTKNYQEEMNQPWNTFKAGALTPGISGPVNYAIGYLSIQNARYNEFLSPDLKLLRENPGMNMEELLTKLAIHKNKPKLEGRYYDAVVAQLARELHEQDFSMLTPIASQNLALGNGQAAHRFFQTEAVAPLPTLAEQLESYRTLRQREWGGFHYNFLGILSVIYFISDCLCKTNYYNSKHRDIKIKAVTTLLENENPQFTADQRAALLNGRLGKIILAHGGIEASTKELFPSSAAATTAVSEDLDEFAVC